MALGVHFGSQGVPLGAFGAQSVPRTALLSYGRSILSDFGAQRSPKGSQNGAKIIKKSIEKSIEILVGFLVGFWSVFG